MMWYAYLFEAKSIQSWLFESGRLRDIVGGSELLDGITAEPLNAVVEAIMAHVEDSDINFSRRAGGAIYALSQSRPAIELLSQLWPIVVTEQLPGLPFETAISEADSPYAAFNKARDHLRRAGAHPRLELPTAPPVARRAPRTGRAAVSVRYDEAIDSAVLAKTGERDRHRAQLANRFTPEGALGPEAWPVEFEGEFPFDGADEARRVAVIHADGNGLGQVLMAAHKAAAQAPSDRFVSIFKTLSHVIQTATEHAARHATSKTLLQFRENGNTENSGKLPGRPVILGGDDLTVIIRADLALPFAVAFLKAFERETVEAMKCLRETTGLSEAQTPRYLTATAGIAYIGAKDPFARAADLAEDLTSTAKRQARALSQSPSVAGGSGIAPPVASAIAFYRPSGSLVQDYESLLEWELTFGAESNPYRPTFETYGLSEESQLPPLSRLVYLQQLFDEGTMAYGPARELLTLVGLDRNQAKLRYRRWRAYLGKHAKTTLDRFDDHMTELAMGKRIDKELPFFHPAADEEEYLRSPFADLATLVGVNNRADVCAELLEGDTK